MRAISTNSGFGTRPAATRVINSVVSGTRLTKRETTASSASGSRANVEPSFDATMRIAGETS